MRVVYVDQVFLLNLAVDYLLLLTGAGLAGTPLRRVRFLICAAGGGLYAAAGFLPAAGILLHPLTKAGTGALMAWLAYRKEPHRYRLIMLFFLLSGTLAGLLLALGFASGAPGIYLSELYYGRISWPGLLLGTLGLNLLLQLIFRQGARHGGGELLDITVSIGGRTARVRTLYDTGNTLRNPIDGSPVLVLEQTALQELWPPALLDILRQSLPAEGKMAQIYQLDSSLRFSLLTFRSVGVSSGLLLAVHSDYIRIGEKCYPKTLIALSPGPVSDGGAYAGLWGGEERRDPYEKSAAAAPAMDQATQQAG